MYEFYFHNPTKIYFGTNAVKDLGSVARSYGSKALLVYGGGSIKEHGIYDAVTQSLQAAGVPYVDFGGIAPNPRIESVRAGAKLCKEENVDLIIAVGGGSTLDASKFIAAAALDSVDPWRYFNEERAPIHDALPLLTVPTLAATGSEMDAGGVLSNPDTGDKIGRTASCLFPKASFLDPSFTYSVNAFHTACGVADALSHLIETYFNAEGSMYMLDRTMEAFMETLVYFAPIALENPQDEAARANILWASTWAINGFVRSCQQCDWSCHAIEHQLSARYDIAHGLGLAILTPRWLRHVLDEKSAPRIARFGEAVLHCAKEKDPYIGAEKAIRALEAFFFETLALPSTLQSLGIDDALFEAMAQKATHGRAILGYRTLSAQDVVAIYQASLDDGTLNR